MSLEQLNSYIVTFFTHSGAVAYKRYLSKLGTEAELMPVPRSLSSSCGVCLRLEYSHIMEAVTTDVDCIYKMSDGKYYLIYECEE
ncbi:MAG: DUF3343 domain-containing protein [Filifactoraceae bacterium]